MILCCGEALIDMLPAPVQDGAISFVPHRGGAVYNTAIALGRLGSQVGFLSGVSSDFFGEMLVAGLADSRVDTSHLIRSARPTTLAFVALVEGQAKYVFYDENSAGRMVGEADLPLLGPDVAALHFSCISLVAEPSGSAYEALARREAGRRVIMLDPNIRTGFITDVAAHRARMRRMRSMADIVKLSDEDLAWFGEEGSDEEIARRWLAEGPSIVVITHGARGARAFARNAAAATASLRVEVVDTVGAGDTFNAGMLHHLDRAGLLDRRALGAIGQDDLAAMLHTAARAAAITVSRAGANPPWAHELA
jgi:fructokinase